MRSRLFLLAAAAVALAAHPAAAQHRHHPHHDDDYDYRSEGPPRHYLGGELTAASPQGEFHDYVNSGWGGGLHYLLRVDRDGWLALRADASLINYGHERQRVPLSSTIGGRIDVDLVTDNNIAFFGFGPQVGVPTGAIRPYANGFAGVSYIFTESSVRGTSSGESFASTTNFDDSSFAYGAGGGVYIPVSRGWNPVSLDLGVSYRHNGTAEYLREGDITDNPDGSITLHPVFSETNLLTFHVGVSVGLR